MSEHPLEVNTDHRCVLAILAHRLAEARDGDGAALAADALTALLRAGHFERCCVPRYLALAPAHAREEVQIPIATAADIATRVIVWPVGARDSAHAHDQGWTVFAPVRGELVSLSRTGDAEPVLVPLERLRPRVLRPEADVHHSLRNAGADPALSVHVFGSA